MCLFWKYDIVLAFPVRTLTASAGQHEPLLLTMLVLEHFFPNKYKLKFPLYYRCHSDPETENHDFTQQCVLCAGVDENTIIEVLVKRSNEQRQQIREAYLQASGKVINKDINGKKVHFVPKYTHSYTHMIICCHITHWLSPRSLWNQLWRTLWREIWRMWCWLCWKHRPSTMPSSWKEPWRYTHRKTDKNVSKAHKLR